jgi:hypothetical protein
MAQSSEEVAFRLMETIANIEKMALHGGQVSGEQKRPDRAWILSDLRRMSGGGSGDRSAS